MKGAGFRFVVHWGLCEDPQEWKKRCERFLSTLTVDDIPIPESGTEGEQLQQIEEWALRAFVESIDARDTYRREFLSIEVQRVRR